MDLLTQRDKKILKMFHFQNKNVDQVAKTFGVTRERIKALHIQALQKFGYKTLELLKNK